MNLRKVTIIGVGLIGGSFALALKKAGLVEHVCGYGRSQENLETALDLKIIDSFTLDFFEAVSASELIFIATPVGSYTAIFEKIKRYQQQNPQHQFIITDAGSTKVSVINLAKAVFNCMPDNFVPGHPIAGTENSGASAAFDHLFEHHRVILTPEKNTHTKALELIQHLWQEIGAQVVIMDAEYHDMVLGATSHLPHVIAFSLVSTLAQLNERKEIFDYAAGGFKDFTRIASSNPQMWLDICIANKSSLLSHLQHFQKDLQQVTQALAADNREYLLDVFSAAKRARDKLIKQKETHDSQNRK